MFSSSPRDALSGETEGTLHASPFRGRMLLETTVHVDPLASRGRRRGVMSVLLEANLSLAKDAVVVRAG